MWVLALKTNKRRRGKQFGMTEHVPNVIKPPKNAPKPSTLPTRSSFIIGATNGSAENNRWVLDQVND